MKYVKNYKDNKMKKMFSYSKFFSCKFQNIVLNTYML